MKIIAAYGLRLFGPLASLLLLTGCGGTPPPSFRLNMVEMASKQIPEKQQQEVANILEALFGTPDEPFVLADMGLDLGKLEVAAGPVRSDQFGKETGLYRRHCAHCHGTTGDALGPTALILNPYPRDYRQGKFKFKSTERAAKPTQYDLEVVLRHGVQGTAMPSFDLLPDPQVKALVEYVKYLSVRGQTEIGLINAISELGEGESLQITRGAIVDEIVKPVVESWSAAQENIIQPEPKPEVELAQSISQGRELFYGAKANCVKCHGPGALGDGQTNDYDDWNKPIAEMTKTVDSELGSLGTDPEMPAEELQQRKTQLQFDKLVLKTDALPPRTIAPRNLRQNVYRGGRRPIDLYRRIYAGINGAPMPGVGPATPGATGTLSSQEIWNLVDYVRSLPYEPISEPPRQKPLVVSQNRF
ncbi:MAG TPA: c-type cytochrome [Pirellulales bacterium]|nr:c-type cytochrome [Pirellulales bacterium]